MGIFNRSKTEEVSDYFISLTKRLDEMSFDEVEYSNSAGRGGSSCSATGRDVYYRSFNSASSGESTGSVEYKGHCIPLSVKEVKKIGTLMYKPMRDKEAADKLNTSRERKDVLIELLSN